jgi:hypothetical protein
MFKSKFELILKSGECCFLKVEFVALYFFFFFFKRKDFFSGRIVNCPAIFSNISASKRNLSTETKSTLVVVLQQQDW